MIIVSNFLTKSLVSVVLIALTFLTNSSYSAFSTTSVFTTSFSLLKSTGAGNYFSTSNLYTFQTV